MSMLYENEKGKEILRSTISAVEEYGMEALIKKGVVLGLSGGADSVMLLHVLIDLKRKYGDFKIRCVHVNHMIRGNDADDDEAFCKSLCEKLGIFLSVHRIDVPMIAKEARYGLEEAARNVRYEILERERLLLSADASIAVAHNATDNLETMIFNMMRGTGATGLAGIKPVRDHIIRPLINVSKQRIVDALKSLDISYVTDKTNFDTEYTRNYIRKDILPLLNKLTPSPEEAATRVSKNLREDIKFIDDEAEKFLKENYLNGYISIDMLKKLPKALLFRVLIKIVRQKTELIPERIHFEKIYSLLDLKDFEYSLPGKVKFVSRGGHASIADISKKCMPLQFRSKLSYGVNTVEGFNDVIIISDTPSFESYSNVYKIEICATLPSNIIKDELYVRNKEDGDSYSYGGITHKLKKLFSDRKIPTDMRELVPVICDSSGILWVPGFGVRNEESGVKQSFIAIAKSKYADKSNLSFFVIQRK